MAQLNVALGRLTARTLAIHKKPANWAAAHSSPIPKPFRPLIDFPLYLRQFFFGE